MEKVKTYPYDSADYLTSHEAIVVYVEDAFETRDVAFIALALGVAVRAKGMTEVVHKTGLPRESLYKALSAEGNPELATILRVMKALDLKITATEGENGEFDQGIGLSEIWGEALGLNLNLARLMCELPNIGCPTLTNFKNKIQAV